METIRDEDIKEKVLESKRPVLLFFFLPTSGSMPLDREPA